MISVELFLPSAPALANPSSTFPGNDVGFWNGHVTKSGQSEQRKSSSRAEQESVFPDRLLSESKRAAVLAAISPLVASRPMPTARRPAQRGGGDSGPGHTGRARTRSQQWFRTCQCTSQSSLPSAVKRQCGAGEAGREGLASLRGRKRRAAGRWREEQNPLPPGSESPAGGLADAPKAWKPAAQTGAHSTGLSLIHAPGPPLTRVSILRHPYLLKDVVSGYGLCPGMIPGGG